MMPVTHLFERSLTDHMTSVSQHREAEAPVELLSSGGTNELGIVAWLEVALCGDM